MYEGEGYACLGVSVQLPEGIRVGFPVGGHDGPHVVREGKGKN